MMTSINNFADAWLEYFSTTVIQNTIFLGIIFLALYLLRKSNARIKYAISLIGMIKLLVPPFLPVTFGTGTPATTTPVLLNMNVTVLPAEPVAPQLSVVGILFLLWSAAIFLTLVVSLLSTARLKWRLQTSSFLKSLFIDDVFIDLYQSKKITVPMSIGIRPNRIYVPETWSDLSPHQQDSLLRHEVAHIQRWDGLYHILQVIAQAIYFFHPLVWLLNSRINDYREMVCDDIAVERSHMTPLLYSRCLVHVAENMLPTWSTFSASALIKQRNKLYHRVNYQVKENKMFKLSKRKFVLTLAMLLMVMVSLSWYCSKEAPAEIVERNAGGSESENQTSRFERYQESINRFQQVMQMHPADSAGINSQGEINGPIGRTDETNVNILDKIPEPIGGLEAIRKNVRYPEIAKKAGIEGRVFVHVHVDERGNVVETEIIISLGNNGCDEAAIDAIKKVKWSPAERDGNPVSAWVAIPVEFKLENAKNISQNPTFEPSEKAVEKSKKVNDLISQGKCSGKIVVGVHVSADGRVLETRIEESCGNAECDNAIAEQAASYTWQPALENGKPVAKWTSLETVFEPKE